MGKIFECKKKIHFSHSDSAGIMFFSNIFTLAHDVFEEFIVALGIPWTQWFKENQYIVPIRHASCDFFAPLLPGEKYTVNTQVQNIGESSFTMIYSFVSGEKIHASIYMTHTFVDRKTSKKTQIPESYRQKLSLYTITD